VPLVEGGERPRLLHGADQQILVSLGHLLAGSLHACPFYATSLIVVTLVDPIVTHQKARGRGPLSCPNTTPSILDEGTGATSSMFL
jgi:hypothetical protein